MPSPPASRRHTINGILFCAPAIVGLLGLTLYPLLASLYYSFCSYSALKPPVWVGTGNYQLILRDIAHHGLLYESIFNTLFYAALSIPLGVALAFFLALLLN